MIEGYHMTALSSKQIAFPREMSGFYNAKPISNHNSASTSISQRSNPKSLSVTRDLIHVTAINPLK
jgi:hypothetical protein